MSYGLALPLIMLSFAITKLMYFMTDTFIPSMSFGFCIDCTALHCIALAHRIALVFCTVCLILWCALVCATDRPPARSLTRSHAFPFFFGFYLLLFCVQINPKHTHLVICKLHTYFIFLNTPPNNAAYIPSLRRFTCSK